LAFALTCCNDFGGGINTLTPPTPNRKHDPVSMKETQTVTKFTYRKPPTGGPLQSFGLHPQAGQISRPFTICEPCRQVGSFLCNILTSVPTVDSLALFPSDPFNRGDLALVLELPFVPNFFFSPKSTHDLLFA